LQDSHILENILIILVEFDGIRVTFQRLLVISLAPIDHAENMPANVTCEVVAQTLLAEIACFFFACGTQLVENEALHGSCFAVLRVLFEDLLACLETLLVLLRLVVSLCTGGLEFIVDRLAV
jgi:hypothetical protein